MTLRVCAVAGCPVLSKASRCPAHTRAQDKARGTSTARGYGAVHQRLRKAELATAYGKTCHLCGEVMLPGQPLALDHTEDRTGYRGMTHLSCNAADGARRGNAMR